MTNTQITLVQIDNYGPWTVTPQPQREADLQTLQSRLYADLAQLLGNRGGYIFFTRFDNMVAVTNGLDRDDHARIQKAVGNRYPVTVSLSIAVDPLPVRAIGTASTQLQAAGSAQDQDRREVLRGDPLPAADRTPADVHLAHLEPTDATRYDAERSNAFDAFIAIEQTYRELMQYLRRSHDALSFYVGRDRVIAVCPALSEHAYLDVVTHCRDTVGVDLRVGVGRAATASDANMAAKHALQRCRDQDTAITIS